jgi:hypothetical protein
MTILEYWDWLGTQMGVIHWEDWYQVTPNDVLRYHGSSLIRKFGTIRASFVNAWPVSIDWQPWLFGEVSNEYWNSKENVIFFLEWISKNLNIKKSLDWYFVRGGEIIKRGGGGLMNKFVESLSLLYPGEIFEPWVAGQAKIDYWDQAGLKRHEKSQYSSRRNIFLT